MVELYEAVNSIYCYPNSEVLVNKLNIHDNKKLAEVERKLVLLKSYELRQNKKIGNFDILHFLSIHKFLFGDIYPFAGKIRTEDIAKDNFRFAKWEYIEEQLRNLLEKLSKDDFEKLTKEEMSKKLSYYMSELNVLHPFREGNGRTIREFIRELAFKHGYYFEIKEVSPEEMLLACIQSTVDTEHLENLIYKCLEKID
jgi:cell filamentation protein